VGQWNDFDPEPPSEKLPQTTPKERGPWQAGVVESDGRVFVESHDFTHDVRLYVDGDFRNDAERLAYAEEITRRLNAWKPPSPEVVALWDMMGDMTPERRAKWTAAGTGPSTLPARAALNLLWMVEDYQAENGVLRTRIAELEAPDGTE